MMMQRAKNITGPYTDVRQLSHPQREAMEPNQGALVQTEKGDWFFLTHHGTGQWEGRCASLLPVTWADGWPVIGNAGPDGIGTMVWSAGKPVAGAAVVAPQTDDDFNGPRLGVQWEWNFQPRADWWSLTERPGFLRLRAFKPLRPDDLEAAGNTLTQRVFRTGENVVTVLLDLTGMADGQVAGLGHYSRDFATLGVRQISGVRRLEFARDKQIATGPEIAGARLWLRSSWGLSGLSEFSYSLDGVSFARFGEAYQLGWGHYRGDRIALYSYNNAREGGYVDIDSFRYRYDSPANRR
jgi:beta-xylosidase